MDAFAAVQAAFNVTSIANQAENVGHSFQLLGNYPNPFNPSTHIRYKLSVAAPVRLSIYDINGRLVKTLLAGEIQPAGYQEILWDGHRDNGTQAASGIYIYRLRSKTFSAAGKLVLLR